MSLPLCALLHDVTQGEDLVCASFSFLKPCQLSSQLLVHCVSFILARILPGTDSKVIPCQLLRAPFFRIFTMTLSVQSSGNFFSSLMSVKSSWSKFAVSCGSALKTSALRLSCPGDFSVLEGLDGCNDLFFSWDGCWHPGLSLPLVYLPLLVVVVCSELHWSVPSIVSCSDSVVSSHPCLSMIRVSMPPLYLPHTSSVILKTLPCSPLLAASSAWLARSFMWKWQKELWKGHWERRMWHHEWQWREATGNLHHLWFCYWRDALSTPRPCTPPTEETRTRLTTWWSTGCGGDHC